MDSPGNVKAAILRAEECRIPYGLVVRVRVSDLQGREVCSFKVDFTQRPGRQAIAEAAQWAMPAGLLLSTVAESAVKGVGLC